MVCRKCGNIVNDNSKYCNVCGAKIEEKQSNISLKQSKGNVKKKGGSTFLLFSIAAIIVFIWLASGGYKSSNKSSSYSDTLRSGEEKYWSGESMTKEEYNAVKNYHNWLDEQGDKTYNEWDN